MNFFSKIAQTFFKPTIFTSLKDEKGWWRGLVSLLVSMLLVYSIILLVAIPSQTQKVSEWISWFGESIESIDYDQDSQTLKYETTRKLPYHGEKDDFSLVLSSKDHEAIEGYDTAGGAIFTPKEIVVWLSQAGQRVVVPVVQGGKIMDNVSLEDFFKDTGKITAGFINSFTYVTIFIYLVAIVLSNLIYIILTTLFIIFVRRLLNGKNNDYGFRSMFNLYCYIAIPPMSLAVIYSSLPNSSFEFSLTYMVSLFFFITFVVRKPLLSTYKKSKEQ